MSGDDQGTFDFDNEQPRDEYAEAARLAREGEERAARGVTSEWKAAALALVESVAYRLATFTSDDLYPEVHELDELNRGRPVNRSALGPILKAAAKEGWITNTGERRDSHRAKHHLKPLRVWRSLIVREQQYTN